MKKIKNALKNVFKITVIVMVITVFVVSYIDFGFRGRSFQQPKPELEENKKKNKIESTEIVPAPEIKKSVHINPPAKDPFADFWSRTSTAQ